MWSLLVIFNLGKYHNHESAWVMNTDNFGWSSWRKTV